MMTPRNGRGLDFDGQVVLITGGATGIGRAVAVAFATHGAQVAIGDINEQAVSETLSLVEGAGCNALLRRTDVSQESDVAALVSETVKRFGRLDCAFDNAGIVNKEKNRRRLAELDTAEEVAEARDRAPLEQMPRDHAPRATRVAPAPSWWRAARRRASHAPTAFQLQVLSTQLVAGFPLRHLGVGAVIALGSRAQRVRQTFTH